MKKVLILILLFGLCLSAEAAEKLLIKQLSVSGDVSTDNVASKLLQATLTADPRDAVFAILVVSDGSTERITLSSAHDTATWGPFDRNSAPIFETDIAATITTDGTAKASFTYIELE